jgi:kinetochore protein Spc25
MDMHLMDYSGRVEVPTQMLVDIGDNLGLNNGTNVVPISNAISSHSKAGGMDFRGVEMRSNMSELMHQFDQWVLWKKNQVISERDQYTKVLTEQADQVELLKKTYQELVETKTALMATLEKENKDYVDRENDLKALIDQRSKMSNTKVELERKLSDLQARLKKETEIHEQKERIRQATKEREQPELEFFKKIFALEIEALRKDLMKFIFSNIDSDDWSKEYVIIIDVSSSNYRVTLCEPMLSQLELLIQDLNTDRDFYLFLKRVRQCFVDSVKQHRLLGSTDRSVPNTKHNL